MAWYPIARQSAFSNTTLIGTSVEFIPHVIFENDAQGNLHAYGLVASIISNITWAMGINLKVRATFDGTYGRIDADGKLYGAFDELNRGLADIMISPAVRIHPIETMFPKAYALDPVNVRITSGMKRKYQKASSSLGNTELITEIYPVVSVFLCVCTALSTLSNVIVHQDGWRRYFHIFSVAYVQSFFLEASHVIGSRRSKLLTFSSKMYFASFIIGMFLISNYLQTSLKSSYMIEIETERIRTMKDVRDRPDLVPLMNPETPWILEKLNAPYWKDVVAQHHRFRPESYTPFHKFYIKSTLDKLIERKAVLFTDEYGFIFMLPKLCPLVKGNYFYTAPEVSCETRMTWFFRHDINKTLIKEIDKRLRWLQQSDVPWLPRFSLDPSTSECYVTPMSGEALASGEGQILQVADLLWIFAMPIIGGFIAFAFLLAEAAYFQVDKNFLRK